MGFVPDSIPSAAREPSPPAGAPLRRRGRLGAARWLIPAAAFVLLVLANLPGGDRPLPGAWTPAAGVALALTAWLGRRGVLLAVAAGLLTAAGRQLLGAGAGGWAGLGAAA